MVDARLGRSLAALALAVAGCAGPSVASEFSEQLDPATHLAVPADMPALYWQVVFSVGFDAGIYDSYRSCVERSPDVTVHDFVANPVLVNRAFDTGYQQAVAAFVEVCGPASTERNELDEDARSRHVFRFTRLRYSTGDSHPDLSRGRAAAAQVVQLAECDLARIIDDGVPPLTESNGTEFMDGYRLGLDEAAVGCVG